MRAENAKQVQQREKKKRCLWKFSSLLSDYIVGQSGKLEKQEIGSAKRGRAATRVAHPKRTIVLRVLWCGIDFRG